MALTTCPECDGSVSDAADRCPHCGYPLAPVAVERAVADERAPGWYTDPTGEASHEAYWDGEKWTGDTRRPGALAIPPASHSPKGRPWLFAAGAFLVLGSFLPWAQAGIFSFSGTRGDGVLTLIAGVIIALLGIVRPSNVIPGLVAILLSIGSAWVAWNVVRNFSDTPENIGAGVFVVGLGGVVGVIGGIRALDDRGA